MTRYHAHVYFRIDQLATAQKLVDQIQRDHSPLLRMYKLFDHQVGPHALPMLELHFDGSAKLQATQVLDLLRDSLSVLIHEDTGDDHRDHTHVTWLGEPFPIDFKFFDLVKARPDLAVHGQAFE